MADLNRAIPTLLKNWRNCVLAATYPLLDVFLTMLWFFLFVIWIFLLFRVIIDIFRSPDMGGFGKAGWLIFVILLPFLGVFVYLIARGKQMGQRDMEEAQAHDEQLRASVQEAGGSQSPNGADELAKLADLRDQGVISSAEFEDQKARILS